VEGAPVRTRKADEPKLMTFGQHLDELRMRLILVLLGFAVVLVTCWVGFRFALYRLLWWPMRQALREALGPVAATRPGALDPVFTSPTDAFMTLFKTTFVAAAVLASPWLFYQLWAFIGAGLYRHERRYVYILLPFSLALFLAGVFFCYFVMMPWGLGFLVGEGVSMSAQPLINVNEYFSFWLTLMLVFGLAFQLPLVMMFLVKAGIVELQTLRKKRRHAILVLVILAALVTPTTDMVSEVLLSIPLVALYELGILMARVRLGRSRRALKPARAAPRREPEDP
jgi:sec-independent protein translocase protein TatC